VAVTDAEGRFGFLTVRPGAYPEHTEPAHIHVVVGAPAHDVRYLDIWFEDDPLITPARRESARTDPVISIVTLKKDRDGTLTFQQDIRLEPN
jgi:protocatechuate 3,4-dioxygenase beta subunit